MTTFATSEDSNQTESTISTQSLMKPVNYDSIEASASLDSSVSGYIDSAVSATSSIDSSVSPTFPIVPPITLTPISTSPSLSDDLRPVDASKPASLTDIQDALNATASKRGFSCTSVSWEG
jgi:hypothetical protein